MSILLQGGTILTHDAGDHVIPIVADLLIKGDLIVKIGLGVKVNPQVTVIDCTDKLLCPGFIDTHHHLWQNLLKGRHANQVLVDYFAEGISTG